MKRRNSTTRADSPGKPADGDAGDAIAPETATANAGAIDPLIAADGEGADGEVAVVRIATGDIAKRAYELFLERGEVSGHDLEDWLTAERELREAQQGSRQ